MVTSCRWPWSLRADDLCQQQPCAAPRRRLPPQHTAAHQGTMAPQNPWALHWPLPMLGTLLWVGCWPGWALSRSRGMRVLWWQHPSQVWVGKEPTEPGAWRAGRCVLSQPCTAGKGNAALPGSGKQGVSSCCARGPSRRPSPPTLLC